MTDEEALAIIHKLDEFARGYDRDYGLPLDEESEYRMIQLIKESIR